MRWCGTLQRCGGVIRSAGLVDAVWSASAAAGRSTAGSVGAHRRPPCGRAADDGASVATHAAQAKAAAMGDLGAENWRGFICVEVAQARR